MENFLIKCNAQTQVLFNFEKQAVVYSRSGWANETLGLKDIEIPFNDITGFVMKAPKLLGAGKFSLIVNNTRLFTHTGKDFTDSDLTEVTLQGANYKLLEQAVKQFCDNIKKVSITDKCDNNIPKAQYTKSETPFDAESKEYRMRCNVCGNIYCFTGKDLKDNVKAAKSAALSSVGTVAGALSGNWIAGAVNNQNANNEMSKIRDYSRCPKCNSTDVTPISDDEKISCESSNNVSVADELKKFKELLDMGAISQDEFDEKKKQLLGL